MTTISPGVTINLKAAFNGRNTYALVLEARENYHDSDAVFVKLLWGNGRATEHNIPRNWIEVHRG